MLEEVEHRGAGDRGEPHRHKRADRMVHGSKQKGVQAEDITGDHKGQNLPFAVGQKPVAECHSLREHEGRAGHVTVEDDVGTRLEAFLLDAQCIEHADVFARELYEMCELRYEGAAAVHVSNGPFAGRCGSQQPYCPGLIYAISNIYLDQYELVTGKILK